MGAVSHRQVRRRLIAVFNVVFVFGVLALLGGVSLMIFAFGWFSMGEDMRNAKLWTNYPCQVTNYRREYGSSQFQTRQKVYFQISYETKTNKCALVHLDAWVTSDVADTEIATYYSSGNSSFTCFCPTSNVNLFLPADKWSIYKFCYLALREDEIEGLM